MLHLTCIYWTVEHLVMFFGKYTCFQYNGKSVIDYCMESESLFIKVLFFHVHNVKPFLSDHALITKQLYVNYISENENRKSRRIDMPQPYVWNTESPFLFLNPWAIVGLK